MYEPTIHSNIRHPCSALDNSAYFTLFPRSMLGLRGVLIVSCLTMGCNGLSLRKTDGSSFSDTVQSALHLQSPGPFVREYLKQSGVEVGWRFDPVTAAAHIADQTTPEGRLALAELCDLAGRESEL